MLFAVAFLLR